MRHQGVQLHFSIRPAPPSSLEERPGKYVAHHSWLALLPGCRKQYWPWRQTASSNLLPWCAFLMSLSPKPRWKEHRTDVEINMPCGGVLLCFAKRIYIHIAGSQGEHIQLILRAADYRWTLIARTYLDYRCIFVFFSAFMTTYLVFICQSIYIYR